MEGIGKPSPLLLKLSGGDAVLRVLAPYVPLYAKFTGDRSFPVSGSLKIDSHILLVKVYHLDHVLCACTAPFLRNVFMFSTTSPVGALITIVIGLLPFAG